MNERDLELTSLVLVRELLRKRGTDISALERQIDRLTQPPTPTRPTRRGPQRKTMRLAGPINT
jgi:hypothetical protein